MIETLILGKILRASGVQYHVFAENHLFICTIRGKLRKEKAVTTNLLAVGDDVWIKPSSHDQGVIEKVGERRSKLSRRHPGKEPKEQILAVNVDYAVIVMASILPDFNLNRLDRYLSAAHSGGITPIICVNKTDLADEADLRRQMAVYNDLGYIIVYTSATNGNGIDELKDILRDKVSAFVGSSGVGKSSLINAIQPDLALKVKEIREKFLKGQHTTTAAELLTLDFGGMVVDTPGMREFALWQEKEEDDNSVHFPEIDEASGRCKFRNCSHIHEPGCEVRRLVGEGQIDSVRYKNYCKLVRR